MLPRLIQTTFALLLLIISTFAANSPLNVKEIEDQIAILTNQQNTLGTQSGYYPVTKVIDGDTIKVEIDGKIETIRLIGIDTPETVDPRSVVECLGKEASDRAKELLNGKNVRLESDDTQSDRDRYARLLRYVYLEDGTHINKQLIEEGYAYEYTYDNSYKYQTEFKEAERLAQYSKKGLWNLSSCKL